MLVISFVELHPLESRKEETTTTTTTTKQELQELKQKTKQNKTKPNMFYLVGWQGHRSSCCYQRKQKYLAFERLKNFVIQRGFG